jgi:hypothetical protein
VSDSVGFEEAGVRFFPMVSFDGDMFSDQSSRFGGGFVSFFVFDPSREKESVDGGCRDLEEVFRCV